MDAARQGYLRSYGGSPGLRYLLREFATEMEMRGLDAQIQRGFFVDNPARAFSFAEVDG
jgi:5-phospho-D-xylono-1,4-lactonase